MRAQSSKALVRTQQLLRLGGVVGSDLAADVSTLDQTQLTPTPSTQSAHTIWRHTVILEGG